MVARASNIVDTDRLIPTVVRPILNECGFSLIQTTMSNSHGAALQTKMVSTSAVPSTCRWRNLMTPKPMAQLLPNGRRYSVMALLGLVTEDDDAKSATITLEDRLADIFASQTLEDLRGADIKHGSGPLTKTEEWAIRACVKAMGESLGQSG